MLSAGLRYSAALLSPDGHNFLLSFHPNLLQVSLVVYVGKDQQRVSHRPASSPRATLKGLSPDQGSPAGMPYGSRNPRAKRLKALAFSWFTPLAATTTWCCGANAASALLPTCCRNRLLPWYEGSALVW